MLTQHERSVAVRALSIAYHRYRDRSIKEFCIREKVFLEKDPAYGGGLYHPSLTPIPGLEKKYYHCITLYSRLARIEKPITFWHEAGHHVLGKLYLFSSRVGYDQYCYEFTHDHWENERLAEAFALAIVLYRAGIEPIVEGRDKFFFADESSLCYEQLMRFSANRIAWYCQKAQSEGTNLNLAGLEELERHLRKSADEGPGTQPDLPMNYRNTHREGGILY